MTLVIIPARMNSTRLPGKPLLKIGDRTIIERCFEQAKKAGLDPWVATDSVEIAKAIGVGGRCVKTGDCASGTDRVAAAAEIIDPEGKHEFVINYQGDMPFLDPEDLKRFVAFREKSERDIVTGRSSFDFVNCWEQFERDSVWCHVGIYGFTRTALKLFASLPQSFLEKNERLEQLRAPYKFKWEYFEFPSMPIEINTQADLDRARLILGEENGNRVPVLDRTSNFTPVGDFCV